MSKNGAAAVRIFAFLCVSVITTRNILYAFQKASVADNEAHYDTSQLPLHSRNAISIEKEKPVFENDRQAASGSTTLKNISSVFSYRYPASARGKQMYYDAFPAKVSLKIYVYDDMPVEFVADIETHMYNKYVNESAELNIKADLAILQLFRTYPGRTWDPKKADIFFVPYPHASHCYVSGEGKGCDKVKNLGKLMRSLTYRTEANKDRHLFMTLQDHSHIAFRLRDMTHLKLVTGPRLPSSNDGVIVVPTFNDALQFQPSAVMRSEAWWTRPRKHAFCYFYAERHHGLKKSPNATRRFRRYFSNDIRQRYHKNEYILGKMPFLNVKMGHGERDWPSVKAEALQAYEDSIFCPVLAGDVAWQSRFFDVIMSGCLPVVLSWQIPEGNATSWFVPHYNVRPSTSTIQESYPFAKGVFRGDATIELDYEAFVVQAPGNETDERDVSNILKVMENMLLHQPEEIQRRQLLMKDAAIAFTYGLGEDSHRYNDAFARIVSALQRHVDICFKNKNPAEVANC
jgi:hypothetical protein